MTEPGRAANLGRGYVKSSDMSAAIAHLASSQSSTRTARLTYNHGMAASAACSGASSPSASWPSSLGATEARSVDTNSSASVMDSAQPCHDDGADPAATSSPAAERSNTTASLRSCDARLAPTSRHPIDALHDRAATAGAPTPAEAEPSRSPPTARSVAFVPSTHSRSASSCAYRSRRRAHATCNGEAPADAADAADATDAGQRAAGDCSTSALLDEWPPGGLHGASDQGAACCSSPGLDGRQNERISISFRGIHTAPGSPAGARDGDPRHIDSFDGLFAGADEPLSPFLLADGPQLFADRSRAACGGGDLFDDVAAWSARQPPPPAASRQRSKHLSAASSPTGARSGVRLTPPARGSASNPGGASSPAQLAGGSARSPPSVLESTESLHSAVTMHSVAEWNELVGRHRDTYPYLTAEPAWVARALCDRLFVLAADQSGSSEATVSLPGSEISDEYFARRATGWSTEVDDDPLLAPGERSVWLQRRSLDVAGAASHAPDQVAPPERQRSSLSWSVSASSLAAGQWESLGLDAAAEGRQEARSSCGAGRGDGGGRSLPAALPPSAFARSRSPLSPRRALLARSSLLRPPHGLLSRSMSQRGAASPGAGVEGRRALSMRQPPHSMASLHPANSLGSLNLGRSSDLTTLLEQVQYTPSGVEFPHSAGAPSCVYAGPSP